MRVAIVTNMNGIGLQRDWELLRDCLIEYGATEVAGLQYDEPTPPSAVDFDLAIFLEVIPRDKLNLAPRRWAFLNPEWCKRDVIDSAKAFVDRVFTKTLEAQRILSEVFPGKTTYLGFMARDRYRESIPRVPKFLHIGGNSSLRGTQAVLDAWKWKRNGVSLEGELTIVSSCLKERPDLPNVRIIEKATDEELLELQNSHLFHIQPSGTEGYGHVLHEAMSVGALIVTTEAPPMDEIWALFLPPCSTTTYNLATVYEVSALDIYAMCDYLFRNIYSYTLHAREKFEIERAAFKKRFFEQLGSVHENKKTPKIVRKTGPLQIAFLGNFEALESTENMVRWALEEGLDQAVWPIQENKAKLVDLQVAGQTCDLFIWIRTPGWLPIPDQQMLDYLASLRSNGVPSISMHLDKFWGIGDREARIGVDPFWKTQFVWTADGGFDEAFKQRGVNHYWMQPAVSEVYIHPGTPRENFRCDVGFVGARDYHHEYPFRKKMIEFLEATYLGDFKHITNIRGHVLNDFYASCKVVVGDCIFAGTPRYWSDRLPETCGRGGFLLHPEVEGLDVPTPFYKPQDLESLHKMVEYWLKNEEQRLHVKRAVTEHIRKNHTWTIRMKEILDVALR